MIYLLIFLAVVAADQLSKLFVDSTYALYDGVTVIKGVFEITNTRNSGAAWSFGANSAWAQPLFISITVVAVIGALVYLVIGKHSSKWLNATVTLIAAGAVGNFIDRLAFGEVRDFINLQIFNCNVADVAITVGAVMLIAYLLFISDDALFKKKDDGSANETVKEDGNNENA